jgi:outer membrane protein TolC
VPPVPSSRRSEPEKAAKTGGPTRDGEIPFGVADTVFLALRNNRTIRSAQIDRIAQKFDLHVVEDRFTPQFGVSGGAVRQRIAGITTTSVNVTPGVTTLLPTGATVGFSWADQTTDTLGIDIRWRQLELARRARGLAARAVEIEKEKLKVGRSANYQVRALENDLRSAENQQLGAVIGYLNALTLLDVQLGTTLDTWHIALRD